MAPRHDAFLSQHDGKSLLALSSLVGLTGADPESRTTWIHVAPFGAWDGHSNGSFELTREKFESVVAQLAGKRTPVSLDYEHASIRPKGDATPAAGYALSAEIRGDGSSPDDGLYALVEFTTRAADFIRKGEYRFCSGVFVFDAEDGQSAAPLICALDTIALTNRPFIDGQKPIVLSRVVPLSNGASMATKIQIADLLKILKSVDTGDGLTQDQITGALALLASGAAPEVAKEAAKAADATRRVPLNIDAPAVALAPKPDAAAAPCADPPPPPPAMPMADVPPVDDAGSMEDDIDARLMAATGLDEAGYDAALNANFDAIVALLLGNASTAALSRDLETTSLRDKLNAATVELNVFRADAAKRHDAEVVAEVDAAIAAGKYLPGQKVVALSLARKDLKGFRDLTASMTVNPLLKPHASAVDAPLGQSENTEGMLPKTHPKVLALSAALKPFNLPAEVVAAKLAELTG